MSVSTECPVHPSASSKRPQKSAEKQWRCWQIGKRHYRVTWADALRGHEEALRLGGKSGIVSEHAIRSAIARPYHGYYRLIHKKAAALVHGVICNHGFADGNKRTALYLLELLIRRSDYEFVADDSSIVETFTSVARGEIDSEELSKWFKPRLIRATGSPVN